MAIADVVHKTGDYEYLLLEECGEPTYRNGNVLVYERGTSSFVMVVRVGKGRILSIQEGDKPD